VDAINAEPKTDTAAAGLSRIELAKRKQDDRLKPKNTDAA
jgi:hypothetical protein